MCLCGMKIPGSADLQGSGPSLARHRIFIKTPISYNAQPLFKTEQFLKPNIGSSASSEKQKPYNRGYSKRGGENKRETRKQSERKLRQKMER